MSMSESHLNFWSCPVTIVLISKFGNRFSSFYAFSSSHRRFAFMTDLSWLCLTPWHWSSAIGWDSFTIKTGENFIFFLSSSSCRVCSHGFPKLSLFIRLYHTSLPAGLPGYILCTAVVDRFLLVVQHLQVHVKKSTREHRLWVHPCSSSSFPHEKKLKTKYITNKNLCMQK